MMFALEPWMGLFMAYFTGHAFALGFFLGSHYVRSVADAEPADWRPPWLQDAIDAYEQSHRRPLSASDVADYDWEDNDR